MIDYNTHRIFCDICKKYLGNYMECTDEYGNEKSYHSLIKTKYCAEHKAEVRRKQNRKAQHTYTQNRRVKKEILQEQLRLAKAENKALRIKLFGTENAEQHKALMEILKA